MRVSLSAGLLVASVLGQAAAGIPDKIYGVNLGSWLVLEAWMLPQEWLDMGGQSCGDCSTCIASEYAFVKAYPDTADASFNKHWSSWFTQSDVDALKDVGINTVRIPLGYWIVERLVDRRTEFYPRGGILQLQRGVRMLKEAGISVILDHHALPGVQTAGQQFTGNCTSDVEFYTPYNYQRALTWTAVMATIAHLDSDFESVFAIEAVNEPIMDATQTPGYGDFQKNFVETIRAVELVLGIGSPFLDIQVDVGASASNITASISAIAHASNGLSSGVQEALLASVPILVELGRELDFGLVPPSQSQREPLVANFMDVNWQYNDPPNPADAAIGPAGYDNHLYYSFGGVADANELAYLISICNLQRVQADAALGDAPLWFGEWGLPTQFDATDEFLNEWADAQKLAYSEGRGWIFWNFKTEISELAGDLSRQWSYLDGVKRGYLTRDPKAYHNPEVCAPYVGQTYTSTTSTATPSTTSSSTTVSVTTTATTATSLTVSDTSAALSSATSSVTAPTTSSARSAAPSTSTSATGASHGTSANTPNSTSAA